MKDKLVSMAPFFVIIGILLGWGFMQGWFSPAKPIEPAEPTSKAPLSAAQPSASSPPAETKAAPTAPVAVAPAEAQTEAQAAEPTPGDAPARPIQQPAPVEGAEQPASTWSTYHGDTSLAGLSGATLPDTPVRLWRFQTNAALLYGPVASEALLHFASSRGELVAIDFSGKKVWSKQLTRKSINEDSETDARVDGPVSCFESTVFVGTMAGTLYAFDAASGEEKWRHEMDSPVLGAVTYQPASATQPKARVFVIGQDDGALHCLSFDDGTPLWKSEPIDRCDGSPAAGKGIISFGSCASAVHVINADDGALLHTIPVGDDSQVAGGVAIRGNSVFSGTHSGQLIHADLLTGEIVWTNSDCEAEVFTTPAVSTDRVIYGGMDDVVYCLDRATGKQVWNYDAQGMVGSAVIAGDKVVVSAGGKLFILSIATGQPVWSFEVTDEITAPSIINDMILVGGKDGSLSAFGVSKG